MREEEQQQRSMEEETFNNNEDPSSSSSSNVAKTIQERIFEQNANRRAANTKAHQLKRDSLRLN
jgi:hypothetical protein